jgi:hypothetical protein
VERNYQLRLGSQEGQVGCGVFGAFDFDIHGAGASLNSCIQDSELFGDAAVVTAMILMAPAGGEYGAFGILVEELADGAGALHWLRQVVEAELKEGFARVNFCAGVTEQLIYRWEPERDANFW